MAKKHDDQDPAKKQGGEGRKPEGKKDGADRRGDGKKDGTDRRGKLKGYRNCDKVRSNDPKYYNKNKVQYELATKVPAWSTIQGSTINTGSTFNDLRDADSEPWTDVNHQFPGVLVLSYAPTVGIAKNGTSPVNRAFNSLMAELYAKTSGSSLNFQQADLANFFISLASAGAGIGAVKRILECKDYWITRNLNYPKTIVRAAGVQDYDDMVRYYNEYVSELDNIIALFNKIKVPARFDIFERQYALAHNIYMDEDSEFGQLYIFRPDYLWEYDDSTGSCDLVDFKLFETVREMLNVVRQLIERWTNSNDCYTISGALQRAFPDSDFLFIEPFTPGSYIKPVTDEFLEMQLMNAVLNNEHFSRMSAAGTFKLTQRPDENIMVFNPTYMVENTPLPIDFAKQAFVRCYKDTPTADDNMEMTRFMTFAKWEGDLGGQVDVYFDSCGTEIALTVEAWAPGTLAADIIIDSNVVFADECTPWQICDVINTVSSFRYIPRIAFAYTHELGQRDVAELNDQYNYTLMSLEDLRRMHETALYSIWNISDPR